MNIYPYRQSTLLEVSLDPLFSLMDGDNDSSLDPVAFAMTAEEAGADGLSVYLSEQNAIVRLVLIQAMLRQFTGRIKINIAATALAVNIAAELSPAAVCLVAPGSGMYGRPVPVDAVNDFSLLQPFVRQLNLSGHISSLFVMPVARQVQACAELGVKAIVLSVDRYTQARNDEERDQALNELQSMTIESMRQGLSVQLGGSVDYQNIAVFAAIADITQVNIGDAIFFRSLSVGWNVAVKEMNAMAVRAGLMQRG